MDFLCLCLRIPKCGSASLADALAAAFRDRQKFYLPHTLNLEGELSALQDLRFHRTRARNLLCNYGTTDINKVFDYIKRRARDGDIIAGGHIDFPSVRHNLKRRVKMIALMRNPADRCRSEYEYLRQGYCKKPPLSRFDASAKQKAAGRYSFRGYLDFLLEYFELYHDLAARYVGWDGEENLSAFFADNVFHFGLLEYLDAFVSELGEKIGREVPFPHRNATAKASRTDIAATDRSRIERLCPTDFELYEWMLQRILSRSVETFEKTAAASILVPAWCSGKSADRLIHVSPPDDWLRRPTCPDYAVRDFEPIPRLENLNLRTSDICIGG